jgi:alkylhydroperoxidase family enzyme
MRSHGAVASYAMGEEVWKAVEEDWRSAPLNPGLKATLVFLEKQTLAPDELTTADVEPVRAAGVSDAALRDAVTVCAMFNMIVRLADSFGWDIPSWEAVLERAPRMLDDGYELEAIFQRL